MEHVVVKRKSKDAFYFYDYWGEISLSMCDESVVTIIKQNNVVIKNQYKFYFKTQEDAENALFQIKFLYKILL